MARPLFRGQTAHLLESVLESLQSPKSSTPQVPRGSQFFRNDIVESYASRKTTPVSLEHMLNFEHAVKRSSEKNLLKLFADSGMFVRDEMSVRLAHRIRDFQELPFIVTGHPDIAQMYQLHLDTFEVIRSFPTIKSFQDNEAFCEMLRDQLEQHARLTPHLAVGIVESSEEHLPNERLDWFVERIVRSRISRRTLAQHHISLSQGITTGHFKGLVDAHMSIIETLKQCAQVVNESQKRAGLPPVVFEIESNDDKASISYLRAHAEYMLLALVQHACRGRIMHSPDPSHQPHVESDGAIHVKATVAYSPRHIAIRISDKNGGSCLLKSDSAHKHGLLANARQDLVEFSSVRSAVLQGRSKKDSMPLPYIEERNDLFDNPESYSWKLLGVAEQSSILSGETDDATVEMPRWLNDLVNGDFQYQVGVDLPLAHMYATHFGGDLRLYVTPTWGYDSILTLPRVGGTQ